MDLRDELVDTLVRDGSVTAPSVEAALRAVPRHVFLPDVDLATAYADDAVGTKADANGVSISAASQPTIVALMLEQAQIELDQRVLEIGAGTGYNAALLAHLTGTDGSVVTVDVDEDIVMGARDHLAAAGVHNVHVVRGDGALGHPERAPYDRIMATVGAWDLPPAWLDQLAPHGRLVVPLRLRGEVMRTTAFGRTGDHWTALDSRMCSFMPLRDGIAADPRTLVRLRPDRSVQLTTYQDQRLDRPGLESVLDSPAVVQWSGAQVTVREGPDWLWLWLTCTLPQGLCALYAEPDAVESGLVDPQFSWGAMAAADGATIAYLTWRDGELGVIGHGPDAAGLGGRVIDEIWAWDARRGQEPRIELWPEGTQPAGQFSFATPHHVLTITWPE